MELLEKFKAKVKNKSAVFGPFMKSLDAAFVETAGYAGFDFVILDMEHGPAGFDNLQNLIRGAVIGGAVPVVRTYDASEIAIARALDLGALGVQVPQITSAGEAQEVVKAAKYYPQGERGVCRFVRAAKYSTMPREDYFKSANKSLVIIQVEGQKAIDNIDEIIAVEGIDIIFIGPYDLSQSLGVPGQVADPVVVDAMKNILARAQKAGVAVGVFSDTPQMAKMWKDAGVLYISYSVDVGIFAEACKAILEEIKN